MLFTLATVVFWVNQAIPQDAGSFLLRNVPNPTREQVQEANHRLGVDRPALEQYADFVGGLVRGDLGVSWTTATYVQDEGVEGESVARLVLRAAAVTGALVLGGMLLLVLVALPLGPYLASRAGSAFDRSTLLLVSLAFVSTHPLVAALMLQLVVGRKLGWLPDQGYCPFFGRGHRSRRSGGAAGLRLGVAPRAAVALVQPAAPRPLPAAVRTQSLSVLRQPFVTVARAKGASEQQVLRGTSFPSVVTVVAHGGHGRGDSARHRAVRRGRLRPPGPAGC